MGVNDVLVCLEDGEHLLIEATDEWGGELLVIDDHGSRRWMRRNLLDDYVASGLWALIEAIDCALCGERHRDQARFCAKAYA